MTLPPARSASTSSTLARHRSAPTITATVRVKKRASGALRPSSSESSVDSESRRCSRAATAAPSMPATSAKCWVKEATPEMPTRNTARSRISATGSSAIDASAAARARFSARLSTVFLQQALDFVERFRRHHLAADHRVHLLGSPAPLGLELGGDRLHLEAALPHRRHGLFLLAAADRAQLHAGGLAGIAQRLPARRPPRLPGLARDDHRADHRRPVHLEHVGGVVVELQGERPEGRAWHHV